MGRIVQITFSVIFLVALVYLAVMGLVAFFDWVNPGGGGGRIARITIGAIIGLGVAAGIVIYRRFRGR